MLVQAVFAFDGAQFLVSWQQQQKNRAVVPLTHAGFSIA